MKILELNPSGQVSIRQEYVNSIPEFAALKESEPKRFDIYITYIYHVYSKDSAYYSLLPMDRKAVVCQDMFSDSALHEKIESRDNVKKALDKYLQLSQSPKEKYLVAIIDKIEEYLTFWKDTKIDKDNHKLIAETLANAENLLKLQDRLEKQVFSEKTERAVGGGKSTLFEEG